MKHSRSSSEWEIREAVVARFRDLWPDARIVHEMNVDHGMTRADVVAVTKTKLVICEIKSERDKLDRLGEQLRSFGPCCHILIVAAHQKWCIRPPMVPGKLEGSWRSVPSAIESETRRSGAEVWEYPVADGGFHPWRVWREKRPWTARMLGLLWVDELKAVCADHRVAFGSRSNSSDLTTSILHHLRQHEIEAAVCRQLRVRVFAEADDPIVEVPA